MCQFLKQSGRLVMFKFRDPGWIYMLLIVLILCCGFHLHTGCGTKLYSCDETIFCMYLVEFGTAQ